MDADQLGERVDGPRLEARTSGGDLLGQALGHVAECPDHATRGCDADRPVAVLHRRVGLRPELGRLAQLEPGLLGQTHGPATADEGDLLGLAEPGEGLLLGLREDGPSVGDGRGEVLAQRRTQQGQHRRGEPGLHHRLLVDLGEEDHVVGELGDRGAGGGHDDDRGHGAVGEVAQELDHLGRGPGPRDRQDRVIGAVQGRLAGGERIRLALAGCLAKRRVGLGHVVGRAAAHDRHTVAATRQQARQLGQPGHHRRPVVGLARDLDLEVARVARGKGGRHGTSRSFDLFSV